MERLEKILEDVANVEDMDMIKEHVLSFKRIFNKLNDLTNSLRNGKAVVTSKTELFKFFFMSGYQPSWFAGIYRIISYITNLYVY
jgi:hypothetical protein